MAEGAATQVFASWMEEVRPAVERRLRAFFAQQRGVLATRAPGAMPLLEAIEDLTLRGGKRFRPALLAAAHRAVCPVGSLDDTLDAGAALELLQSYLLIHDDWMDGDDVRRGGPSVHVLLGAHHPDPHTAASAAILAGDLACAWTWELLLDAAPGAGAARAPRFVGAARAMASVASEVTLGQYLDVGAASDVETVHLLKTASYTTRGPLRLGALLGGATEAQLEALDRFGAALGIAFQLRDDLLGVFGDPRETGKPAGNDLRAGKRTELVLGTERLGSSADREALAAALGRRDATDAEVEAAAVAIDRCGARASVEARADALHRDALACLDDAPLGPEGRTLLVGAAELLVRRSR